MVQHGAAHAIMHFCIAAGDSERAWHPMPREPAELALRSRPGAFDFAACFAVSSLFEA
jgi:hypothetical protein